MSGLPYRPMLPVRMPASGRAGPRECQGEAAHPMRRARNHDRTARRWGRTRALALFAAAALSAMPAAVRAEEPLYLRIRPRPTPEADAAAGTGPGRESGRESVWERADRRARIAIASVCSGCLDARFVGRPIEVPVARASRPPAAAMAAAEESVPSSPLSPAGDP